MTDKGTVIVPATGVEVKITPIAFHRYAKDYLNLAQFLTFDGPFSPVPYFVIWCSIELSLKAFLRVNDVSTKDLRNMKKYGHNIISLLNKAKDFDTSTRLRGDSMRSERP